MCYVDLGLMSGIHYFLKASKAFLACVGTLHCGVADCVGQKPVVKTLTLRSTPNMLICEGQKFRNIEIRTLHLC